jgi:predicted DsbA family dithiol-disulfide isomerase
MDVEIWSDIACPWCYVGKRRFEAALAGFEGRDDVRVTWRSFELDPNAHASRDETAAEHLAGKYGMPVEEARARQEQLARTAAADGLEFHFDHVRAANTFDAHRLTHLAAAHDRQDAMTERLQRAHFTEGKLLSDHETLVRLAAEVGVPEDEAREMLASERFSAEVRADEQTAADAGIHAVPTFVVDRRIAVAGAQQPEVLLELLRRGAPVS